jgi:S1-C subfamily serine protease
VADRSAAATAGFRAGDEIVSFAGQPLISVADIGWALHHSPDQGAVAAIVKRAGKTQALTVALPAGWRSKSDISRRVGTWPMRGMAQGGMVLEDLSDEERAKRGLSKEQMALFVKGVGMYGKHAAAKNAGVQKEDVVIQFANLNQRLTEGQLLGHILQTTKIGERVRITVLRNGQRREFMIPMQ